MTTKLHNYKFSCYFRAFGFSHSGFVKAELITAGLDERKAGKVTQQMEEIVRIPFTNAWYVPGLLVLGHPK